MSESFKQSTTKSENKWKEKSQQQPYQVKAYEEFIAGSFNYEGTERLVYRSGSGPAIIVIHEIPGIYDKVFDFARRLNEAGYTTYLPSLIGKPGKDFSYPYILKSFVKLCISKEFNKFALGKEAPVTNWLRALSRHAHEYCGGPGVGAVGMCFSGGFVMAMMADESVIAPVLSQPAMPLGFTSEKLRNDCDFNSEDIPKIKTHMETHDICALGLRFSHDVMVPSSRFKYLKDTFGDRFEGITIDSSKGNPNKIPQQAHSVLTKDFVDEESHPTYRALQKVLALFEKQLKQSE